MRNSVATGALTLLGFGAIIDKVFGTNLVLPKEVSDKEILTELVSSLTSENAALLYAEVRNKEAGKNLYDFEDPDFIKKRDVLRLKGKGGDLNNPWRSPKLEAVNLLNDLSGKGLLTSEESLIILEAMVTDKGEG